ncbi:glycosyltransferase [Aggregatilinea lenta]|uniref:glycosyltransferase n=1 Tax=Aggregatilinea lenta TaxID=913108 RepID=UPI000E5C1824|nr:glycosyltransferase [Aggregatilinea lenta]
MARNTDKVSVLHVLPRVARGGPAFGVLWLLKYLDHEHYELAICSISPPEAEMARLFEEQGVACISLNSHRFLDLSVIIKLTRLMRSRNATIVHTHLLRPDWYGRLAARIARVPIVFTTVRNEDDKCYQRDYGPHAANLIDLINRMTAHYADCVVAVSDEVERYLAERQRVPERKIIMIPNGVDLSGFTYQAGVSARIKQSMGFARDQLVIGTVCQLRKAKGLQYLIQAAKVVTRLRPDAVFVLVGSGPQEQNLKQTVKDEELGDKIIFLGQRRDVGDLLKGMDLFVLPSLWEGMPRALLEAMATGRPCVVTDIGGSRELVVHEKCGLVVPAADKDSLANAILLLLNSPDLREQYGIEARQRVANTFSAQGVAHAYDHLYKRFLEKKCGTYIDYL